MPVLKDDIITAKVESDLKNEFMIIAASKHRPASQILRDLIRVYVESNRVPNKLTVKTMQRSDKEEDIYYALDAADLFKQLDI